MRGFSGVDGWYHTRISQLMFSEELSPKFRWTAESYWAERFSDKEWLFHLYLAPFARAGDACGSLAAGGKVGGAMLAALVMLVFLGLLRHCKVPRPFLWTLVLIGISPHFLFRMGLVRPHLMSLLLLLVSLYALFSERWLVLFFASVCYPLCYTAFHTLPMLLLVLMVGWQMFGYEWRLRPLLVCVAGCALGCLLHPHMPYNFDSWYIQNVVLMKILRAPQPLLEVGGGLTPLSTKVFLHRHIMELLAWFLLISLALGSRVRASRETVAAFLTAAVFGALILTMRRFVEYWSPFTVLTLALLVRDMHREGRLEWPENPSAERLLRGCAVLGLTLLLLHGTLGAVRVLRGNTYADMTPITDWLRSNTPARAKVFHTDWGDFPELFFRSPHNHYLVGLDPVYFYHQDKKRWRLWRDITAGKRDDPAKDIRQTFGCRYVVVDRSSRVLSAQLDGAPGVKKIHRNRRATLYEIDR